MARIKEPIFLEHRDGRKHTTTDRREANDLIMLRGWRRVDPPVSDTTTKPDEKAEENPEGKAAQKPANKSRAPKNSK